MQLLFTFLAALLRDALDRETLPPRAREMAVRIQREHEEIDELGQDDGAIAERLEAIVRDLARDIDAEYRELLARAAGS